MMRRRDIRSHAFAARKRAIPRYSQQALHQAAADISKACSKQRYRGSYAQPQISDCIFPSARVVPFSAEPSFGVAWNHHVWSCVAYNLNRNAPTFGTFPY